MRELMFGHSFDRIFIQSQNGVGGGGGGGGLARD